MIFSTDERRRKTQVADVIRYCLASQDARSVFYNSMDEYFFTSSEAGEKRRFYYFNAIRSQIEKIKSLIYSGDRVSFSVHPKGIQRQLSPREHNILAAISINLDEFYKDSGLWGIVDQAILCALKYGSCLIKLIIDKKTGIPKSYLCTPDRIGVYDERIPDLDEQEAITMVTYITEHELRRKLKGRRSDDEIERLLARLTYSAPVPQMPEHIINMLVPSGQLAYNQQLGYQTGPILAKWWESSPGSQYAPVCIIPLIEVYESWIWDDSLNDYRVVMSDKYGEIFYEIESNAWKKGVLPFHKITPIPKENYFWGISAVDLLSPLQNWLVDRLNDVDSAVRLLLQPPVVAYGVQGDISELGARIKIPGFTYSLGGTPQESKLDFVTPKLDLKDAWEEIGIILKFMDQVFGLGDMALTQQTSHQIRSHAHAELVTRLGASPIKQMGYRIEDFINNVMTDVLNGFMTFSGENIVIQDGTEVPWGDIPFELKVRVNASSSTPINSSEFTNVGLLLYKLGIINEENLLKIINPPLLDAMLADIPEIIQRKQQLAQIMAQKKPGRPSKQENI